MRAAAGNLTCAAYICLVSRARSADQSNVNQLSRVLLLRALVRPSLEEWSRNQRLSACPNGLRDDLICESQGLPMTAVLHRALPLGPRKIAARRRRRDQSTAPGAQAVPDSRLVSLGSQWERCTQWAAQASCVAATAAIITLGIPAAQAAVDTAESQHIAISGHHTGNQVRGLQFGLQWIWSRHNATV